MDWFGILFSEGFEEVYECRKKNFKLNFDLIGLMFFFRLF